MVEVVLSHPWTGPDGTDHAIGDRLELDVEWANKLVHAGAGKYATKEAARAAGGNSEDFTQVATLGLPAEVRSAAKRSKSRAAKARKEAAATASANPEA